jgi:autotransporter-associated beta strand protein
MFRSLLHAIFLMGALATAARAERSYQGVQTLGDFSALQKLSSNAAATRSFASRIASAFTKAGYNDFGPEFRRSAGDLIAQYDPKSGDAGLKDARLALRRLESALKKDRFFNTPAGAGESLPNYYGLAATFVAQAKVALKNVSLGRNPANSLRNKKVVLWLTNVDGHNITLNGSHSYAGSSTISHRTLDAGSGFVKTDTGTLTLNGTGTYTGSITIASRTLLAGSGFHSANPLNLSGGTLMIANVSGKHWIAFPPDLEIPTELTGGFTVSFSQPYQANGIEIVTGTKFFAVDDDYVAPEGAIVFVDPSLTISPVPAE